MADETTTQTTETQPNGAETKAPGTEQTQENSTETTSASASSALGDENSNEAESALGDEGDDADEKPPVPEFFGAPKNEDGTDKDYDAFTLPEGSAANEELQTSFTKLARELGLNQTGAQKLVDYKTQLDQAATKAWGNHLETLRQASRKDPTIGGANYAAAVTAGRAVIKKFGGADGGAELRSVMKNYGVGDHPAMIRFFAAIGKATLETPTGGGEGSGGSVVEKPLHELFYGDDRQKGT